MFREFCVGGGQKGMAAPGIRALRCPVESSHVSTMTAYVSGGRVATQGTPFPFSTHFWALLSMRTSKTPAEI